MNNNLEDKFSIVYAITEKGPDIIHTNSSTLSNNKLQEMALYHLLLVAQGTWHHTGIFVLPLPIEELKDTHKALYFGFMIKDPEQMDPRTKGTRYGCIITVCENQLIGSLNIIEIEKILFQFLTKIDSYQILKKKTTFSKLTRLINKNIYEKKKNYELNNLKTMQINQMRI